MGCIQSYFKRAHTAGLSPSSTQDSNSNKTGGDDAGSGVHAASTTGTVEKDKVSADFTSTGDRPPEEPESNDTSYGVEATAVRTLAASTGTVAILGTTAKTPQSRRESRVSNLDNEEADNRVDKKDVVKPDSINVEVKDEHKNGGTNLVKKLDEVVNSVEKIETVINSSTITTTVDKIESVIKSSTETKTKVIESPPTKEVVVVEVEHSSKVENVEKPVENPTIQTTTALVEDVKVDDAVSPLEDGGFSESNFAEDEDDRPTTVLEIEKAQSNTEVRTSISEISENEDTKGMDDEISSEQLKTNSLSDTTLSESFNVGLDGIKQAEDEEGATPVVEDVGKSELSEALAAVDSVVELKRSSDKNGVLENDFEKGAELKNKVVDASSNEISQNESKNSEADSKKEVNEEPVVKTVANTKVESAPSNRNSVVDQVLGNDIKVLGEEGLKEVENKVENGLSSVVVNGVPEVEDDKMSAAATTIQASFRGYQTRQQNAAKVNESVETNGKNSNINQVDISEQHNGLPSNNVEVVKVMQLTEIVDEGVEKKLESIIASKEGLIEKVDDKLDAAATAIQASFRGYQTRQNIKKDDNKTEKSVGKEEDSINYTIQGVEVDQTEKETIESVEAGSEKGDSIEKSKTEKKEELVDKTKSVDASHKEKETANKTEPDNVSKKVEESLDKLNSEEAIKTVEKIAVTEDIPVAQNSNSVDAQVEKVPGSVEQTEKVSPKNTQLETVKNSQESSESSSFDSVQNVSLDPVTSVSIKDKFEVAKLDSSDKEVENVEEVKTESKKLKENGSISLEETKEKLKDEEKESLAATTIQANFRGYQARQNLGKKVGEVEESGNKEEALKSGEGEEKGEVEDVKVSTAATKIQAGFRGYQTRKKLKEDEDETVVVEALTSRTPELVESVREEVDEICKRAVETTENLISQGLHKFHKSGSVEEEEEEARKNEGIVDKSDVVDVAKETIEAVVEKAEKIADEKLNSAATTIQASFRGFQARQNLEKNTTDIDGLPDFPPSTEDEDYTPVPDDDDLPLPDLEALESSYSEEMATEPLLPPPPTASGPPPPVTITTNLHNLTIPETEEVSEASTEVGTIEEDLKSLQRPQECDELDRLERDSTDGESSLSSAATKIQAGVRGYLTRKQINQGQAGTTSTSGPSLLSDDRSLGDFSSSREEDGPVRSMISTEEETEVGRHSGSSPPGVKRTVMKKRMSLDSRIAGQPAPLFSRTSRAMSVSAVREDASNEEVWEMLQSELSCAATKIQSNFRGYQARKQLRRGDAVQMPTTSSSTTPGSNSLDGSVSRMGHVTEHTRSSGEYHDMIALTPPNIPNIGEEEDEEKVEEKEEGKTTSQQPNGSRDEDAMVKRRQDESRPQKESEEEAAAKIQAGFRGYKVRRNMNAQDVATATSGSATSCATSDDAKSPQQATTASSNNHSNAEIEAATKIQAGFRGFKTRQELKSSKSSADSK